MPRAGTGYIDFYTDSSLELCWEVKRLKEPSQEMQILYSSTKPVPGTVLRLADQPGKRRYQVWFLDCVTKGPQSVEVEVVEGKVTPVHVKLSPVGTTSVDEKDYSFRGSTKGFGRGTKITVDKHEVNQIGATAGQPASYLVKEQMPYFSSGR